VSTPIAEVIVTTHANPAALDLCLLALSLQRDAQFSVCVAEDGETPDTASVLARRRSDFPGASLRHVSQPYLGFRKNRILNQAIASSAADYLVFLDGDCLAGPGFVARHLALCRPRQFVTAGVVRLSGEASSAISPDAVASGRVFGRDWLREHGAGGFRNLLKSQLMPLWLAGMLERLTPVARTWNGGNVSGWRADLLAVNGFDESLGCGGEDVDLGFRLNQLGVSGRHARYSVTVVHLHHDHPYAGVAERLACTERVWMGRVSAPMRTRQGIAKD